MADELKMEAQGQEQVQVPGHPYVVRGAKICCTCGSHVRRLDMPKSHGCYIRDKAMMNNADCVVGLTQNIAPFGACTSPANQGADVIIADLTDLVPGKPPAGKMCAPVLAGQWLGAQSKTLVDGKPALTTQCVIVCSLGGIIQFMDAGQEVY